MEPQPWQWVGGFPGAPGSVKVARDWLDAVLSGVDIPDEQAATAVLLLSETATNAVRHTHSGDPGGVFTVRVFLWPAVGCLCVQVHDAGSATVARRHPHGETIDSGYGLALVEAFAHTWGVLEPEAGTGVFFDLMWQPEPEQAAPVSAPGM
ncbi:ATP-binding protein [Salinactinospora qingdaonensis]|uniref:Histidine kinase/HSP90-like ATPase domain-containing protein n=1 Tax=Salinactinospora qingdaonensis TaxID=702744 RepID=A0ABP7FU24_9ACTN